jgi:hypothetical protein
MRYWELGGSSRPFIERVKIRRRQMVAQERRMKVKETVSALNQIIDKGFVFTNNLTSFAEVVGFLKDNGIPYEYIDGGKHWKYAIRRTDKNID